MIVDMTRTPDDDFHAAVESVVEGRVAGLSEVSRSSLEYDAFMQHRAVSRISGIAVVNGERVPWSMIEKRTEGPELASPYLRDNGVRELAAYRPGLLDDIAPGIRAPRAYGTSVDANEGITLWLEEMHHEGARPLDAGAIVATAGHLGAMNGRWFRRPRAEPWMFTGWIDRHGQPEAVERGLAVVRRAHPEVVARLGDRVALAERLILEQARVREVLEALPQTICHHDAVGANVFSTRSGTVLIDWESVGPGTVGADLASLVFSSVRRGDASARTAASALDAAVQAYSDGFRSEAPAMTLEEIRKGFDASIALRWKLVVDVAAGLEVGESPRRGSLPGETPEAALHDLILLADLLLDSAGRALDW